jgi:diguanylate cyclase (GGDEF)-like protein/PAS domain S-box-containing protein
MTIHRDIAECRRAEQALRECQDLLQEYLDNANDLIQSVTPGGKLIYVNRKWRKTLGYGEKDLEILSAVDIVSPEMRTAYQSAFARVCGGKPVESWQSVFLAAGGGAISVAGSMQPRTEGGKLVSVRMILSDVTRQIRAVEALSQARKEVDLSYKDLKEHTLRAALLSKMADLLQSCQEPEEVYSLISYCMPQVLRGTSGAVSVVDPALNGFEVVASWGDSQITERAFQLEDCWALRRGKMHLVVSPDSVLRCRHMKPAKGSLCLCAPLTAQGEVLGALHVMADAPAKELETVWDLHSDSPPRLTMTLSDRLSLTLARLRMNESLRQQTIRDPLTSLFNRRFLQESLEREMRRALRSRRPMGVIMLDIDHFKVFNDSFGHHAGDLMLREFGRVLSIQFRGEDIVCRYGGDEFVLILPEAAVEATRQRAEQLRRAAAGLKVVNHDETAGGVTLSLGVAGFPEHGLNSESLMRAVDQALYRAKAEGRDRVVVAAAGSARA